MARVLSLILVVVASVLATVQGQDLGSCQRGRATFYDVSSPPSGTCGFATYSGNYNFAPNQAFFNGAAVCGECFEVTGPKGNFVLMADNLCPTADNILMCSGDVVHFDINSAVFSTIGETVWGVTNTQIRPVVCPTTDPISVIAQGYNPSYFQAVIFNHKVGITGVKVTDKATNAWTTLSRTDYNTWEWSPGRNLVYPITYSVTSKFGESINVSVPTAPTAINQKFTGSTQFSVWTAVPGTDTCPTLYEFDIYVNKLNDGSPQHAAQYWQAEDADSWSVTTSLPSGTTAAARKSMNNWSEWGFWNRGTTTASIPVNLIEAVELQVKVPAGAAASRLQLVWNNYSLNKIVNFPALTSSWTYHKFNISEFGSDLPALTKLAFKNNADATLVDLTIANFRVVRVAGQPDPTSPPVSSPIASPANAPTFSPVSTPVASPSANPPTSSPVTSTPSASPESTPNENPATSVESPTTGPSSLASGNAALTIYALFSVITLTLLVNF